MTRGLEIAVALAALAGCVSRDLATVGPAVVEPRVTARAIVEPATGIARAAADRAGTIAEVLVDEGQPIAAGDPLARIDAGDPAGPLEVRAPISGVVIARRASVGDAVRAGERLFELADPGAIRLRFELEDADAGRVAPGAIVHVAARGGGEDLATARVARLGARMEPRSIGEGGAPIRAGWAVLDASEALPIGRELEASIELGPIEAPACVPRDAIRIRDGWPVVVVPGALGDAELRVRLGAVDARRVAVEGVPPGTRVRRFDG